MVGRIENIGELTDKAPMYINLIEFENKKKYNFSMN